MNRKKKKRRKLTKEQEEALITEVVRLYCAAEYSKYLNDPEEQERLNRLVPEELDQKMLDFIANVEIPVEISLKKVVKVAALVAVAAAVLIMSVLAVYNIFVKPKVKMREEITHTEFVMKGTSQDCEASEIKVVLGYIPAGFELTEEKENTKIYDDNNGKRITVVSRGIPKNKMNSSIISADTENTIVTEMIINELKAVIVKDNSGSNKNRVSSYITDTTEGFCSVIHMIEIDDTEIIRILENIIINER